MKSFLDISVGMEWNVLQGSKSAAGEQTIVRGVTAMALQEGDDPVGKCNVCLYVRLDR